ncbi:MAG TPA: TolC family protein [Gemmatimonadales bacterium]
MRSGALVLALVAAGAATQAHAQAGDSALSDPGRPALLAGPLRLADVYRELEARSPRVRAAQAAAQAAEARIGPARRPPDPRIQFGLMNRDLPGFGMNEPLGMNQVQVTQMVPIAGKLGLAARAARAQAAAAGYRATDALWEQRARAAGLFYDLYQTDRSLEVAEETQQLIRQLAAVAGSMYRVGEARQSDLLRAQVEVSRMTEEIVRMQAMREGQAAQLNALLDRPATDSVPTPQPPPMPGELPPVDSLVALALLQRPELHAGEQDVAAAAAAEQRARREIWPDLEVGVIYGQRGMPEGGIDRMMSFMLGFSVPIWAGSRQGQMRQEAGAMRRMAEADLGGMQAETRARVIELAAAIRRSNRLSRLYRDTVLPQATATVTSALAAYRAGQVDFLTVLDNQMTVNRYRTELIVLDAEGGRAVAELEMLLAAPLTDAGDSNVVPGGTR